MLAVMRDESAAQDRRDRMAAAVAPYTNARLAVVDARVVAEVNVTPLTSEERRQRARALILEAFRERPPRVVEGEYKIIAGKDATAVNCDAQAEDEAADEREG
jgi:hypothetical protein